MAGCGCGRREEKEVGFIQRQGRGLGELHLSGPVSLILQLSTKHDN